MRIALGIIHIMQTIICIGSGPLLTPEDCLRANDSELPVIAVNNAGLLRQAVSIFTQQTAAGGKKAGQA